MSRMAIAIAALLWTCGSASAGTDHLRPPRDLDYDGLLALFRDPPPSIYGPVPIWWWEGGRVTPERITWEMETLRKGGVASLDIMNLQPSEANPPYFSEDWWACVEHAVKEARRIGTTIWPYDQIGWASARWFERAAAATPPVGGPMGFMETKVEKGEADNRAGPIGDGMLCAVSRSDDKLFVVSAPKAHSFYMNPRATQWLIENLFEPYAKRFPDDLGKTILGFFQDELPSIRPDIYTEEFAAFFKARKGYDLALALPALWRDADPDRRRFRCDYFDAYLAYLEETCFIPIFKWLDEHGLAMSHDQHGRLSVRAQTQTYVDYFRTQRWYAVPGNDDWANNPIGSRNYFDAKCSSSIAHLYDRPRVWLEGFHSSGWGRRPEETMAWIAENFAYGMNLYDEHGLYYSTKGGWWELAPPDPHFRQPYWRYYGNLYRWVARLSAVLSAGEHVCDVAVLYPSTSLHAEWNLATGLNPIVNRISAEAAAISRDLYLAGIDNDFIDDQSIERAEIREGALRAGGEAYRAIVLGPLTTIRRSVARQLLEFVRYGGIVLSLDDPPRASAEAGDRDPDLEKLLAGVKPAGTRARIVEALDAWIGRQFHASDPKVYGVHRRIGDVDIFWLVNVKDEENAFECTFRATGSPERWDPWTGEVERLRPLARTDEGVRLALRIPAYHGALLVFVPRREDPAGGGSAPRAEDEAPPLPAPIRLDGPWAFEAETVLDNLWGDFRWPAWRAIDIGEKPAGAAADLPRFRRIGPEARRFRYREEKDRAADGQAAGWHRPAFDDSSWQAFTYSFGPHWKYVGPWAPGQEPIGMIAAVLKDGAIGGETVTGGHWSLPWKAVVYSEMIGTEEPANVFFGPKGFAPDEFIVLPDAPAGSTYLLATHLVADEPVRVHLQAGVAAQVEAWCNRKRVGSELALDLAAGWNEVVLRLRKSGAGPLRGWIVASGGGAGAEALLRAARWIWAPGRGALEVWFQKTFDIAEKDLAAPPQRAEVIITADNDYELYVNGRFMGEDKGFDTGVWKRPERHAIADALVPGRNAITVRCLDQGPPGGFIACASIQAGDAAPMEIRTDRSWRATTEPPKGWQTKDGRSDERKDSPSSLRLDDSSWPAARELGPYGMAPWGELFPAGEGLAGARGSRPDPSPYLQWFQGPPVAVADVKAREASRAGWFRFRCPPGTRAMRLHTRGKVRAWIDGEPAPIAGGLVELPHPAASGALAALRIEQEPGRYAGAAFAAPVDFICGPGTIELGDWSKVGGLETFSGIGVYRRRVDISALDPSLRAILDLGDVRVAAEVIVNGKPVGTSLRRPYRFDITDHLRAGPTEIEVRVANTIANHYSVGTRSPYVYAGQTASGLIGPARLEFEHGRAK